MWTEPSANTWNDTASTREPTILIARNSDLAPDLFYPPVISLYWPGRVGNETAHARRIVKFARVTLFYESE